MLLCLVLFQATSPNKVLVAAIDFGTTFSGYAFSFRHQFKDDPTNCSGRIWKANIGSFKTPTCILLKPDKSFAAFGYDAEDKYSQLASDDEHRNWYYIKHFKMRLHDETVSEMDWM